MLDDLLDLFDRRRNQGDRPSAGRRPGGLRDLLGNLAAPGDDSDDDDRAPSRRRWSDPSFGDDDSDESWDRRDRRRASGFDVE